MYDGWNPDDPLLVVVVVGCVGELVVAVDGLCGIVSENLNEHDNSTPLPKE